MIKKTFFIFIILFCSAAFAFAEQSYTIKAGVSMIDRVPKEFYGTWRVGSKLISTNSEGTFKQTSVDLWNLSRSGNVITLDNPFSGAHASIVVDEVNNKVIKFKKKGDYDNKKCADVVQIKLNGDTFTGENALVLNTISEVDGTVIKSERAIYQLKGEKISGDSIK